MNIAQHNYHKHKIEQYVIEMSFDLYRILSPVSKSTCRDKDEFNILILWNFQSQIFSQEIDILVTLSETDPKGQKISNFWDILY